MARRELQVIEGMAEEVQTRPEVIGGEKTVSGLLDGAERKLTTLELESGKETVRLFKAARSEPSDLRAVGVGVRALAMEQVNTAENGALMIINVFRQEIRPLAVIQSSAREGAQLSLMLRLAALPAGVEPRAVDRRIISRMQGYIQQIKAAKRESGFSREVADLVKESGAIQGYRRSLNLVELVGVQVPENIVVEFQQQYGAAATLAKLVSYINL